MQRQAATQCERGVLLCSKGSVASDSAALRLQRARKSPAREPLFACDSLTLCAPQILKPKCTEALRRIFKVSDVDKDGLLNSAELNQFQQKCFATPLQLQELEGILDLVRAYDPSCVRPVAQHPSTSASAAALGEGITELGFLYLHTIFVQQGRMETTWAVLRKFGYGEGLDLTEDVLSPR